MRLNALAPLTDEGMVLRDLYDASIGTARGIGPIRVRDIAIAHNALAPTGGEPGYTAAQVHGGLESIHAESPEVLQTLAEAPALVAKLQSLIVERTGRADSIDLSPLRTIANVLGKAAAAVAPPQSEDAAAEAADGAAPAAAGAARAAAPGEIRTRQDAVQTLDRVIHYLEQAEPGNPAPLLIARAKKLIGVSFFEIMADLAPNALDTIETVTGKQVTE
jgi:type VI secretion system protein ImpA